MNSGAATILVSHSINQVRTMCNKILWLHKGEQIAFGDDIQTLCDAYEEFLITRKLPQSQDDIDLLAEQFRQRSEERKSMPRIALHLKTPNNMNR